MIRGQFGRVLGIVLAGGKGERLMPLTKYRAKPAVHFAAKYRIVDFAISNLVNSGIFSIYVLVQFKSQSLNEHIERAWQFGSALRGRDFFVTLVPAQMWRGERWFEGTADAVYQNMQLVSLYNADKICVFAADHVYKMDVEQMLAYHADHQADVTVAANVVPSSQASQFGCIQTNDRGRIIAFVEKPAEPPEIPGRPGFSYVSMGNYVFEREILEGALLEDASIRQTSHDFGRDIIPKLVNRSRVFAYDFSTNVLPAPPGHHWREDKPYWRDVGTIQSYWQAHMDLLEIDSEMTLYNPNWPIRTVSFADPPAFTHPSESSDYQISNTLIAEGSRILGARVNRSVLSRNCIVLPGAQVDECVIGQGVVIGRNCRLRRAIVDSHNEIPSGMVIGEDDSPYAPGPSGITTVAMPQMRLRKNQESSQNPGEWMSFS